MEEDDRVRARCHSHHPLQVSSLPSPLRASPCAGVLTTAPSTRRLMKEHAEDLAQIITVENGKPLADARGEIAYGGESAEEKASILHHSDGPSEEQQADSTLHIYSQLP